MAFLTKKYFLGWSNIRFGIKELIKMYSGEKSFFSKKRLESSISFLSGIGVILCYDWLHKSTIGASEISAHAIILFGVGGYYVKQIQNEKKNEQNTP